MKKTILIPTDFSVESLGAVKHAAENAQNEKVDIVLFHSITLSDSITELLFFSKSRMLAQMVSQDFTEACNILQNKYSSNVVNIRTDFFTGSNQTAFSMFLEGNKVDEVYMPLQSHFQLPHKNSFNPMRFIQKANLPTVTMEMSQDVGLSGEIGVAGLFA